MEFQKDTVTFSHPIAHRTLSVTAGGDVIVPDTAPDVDALLWVNARVALKEQSIKKGTLTLSGQASFTALYRPEGAPESPESVTAVFPFSHTEEIPGLSEESFVTVSVAPATVSGILQNSRKLKVSSKLQLTVLCENISSAEVLTQTSVPRELECRSQTVSASRPTVASVHEVSAESEIEIPAGNPEAESIKDIFLCVTNEQIQTIQNKVVWKCTPAITCLYTDPEGNVCTAETEFPVTEILDAPGITEEMLCRVMTSVEEIAFLPSDARHVDVRVTLSVSVTAYETDEIPCITDAYFPGKALECEEETVTVSLPPFEKEESVTRKESVVTDESEPPIARVLFAHAVPVAEDFRTVPGAAEADIRVTLSLLYLSAEEAPRLCAIRREFLYTERMEDARITQGMEADGTASLSHISFCLLSANEAECRVIFTLRMFFSDSAELALLTDAAVRELPRTDRPSIVISFAREGDTLWNIAKRYNVSMESLLRANDVSADLRVTDGMQFLIPR